VTSSNIIEVTNISRTYTTGEIDTHALKPTTFTINQGEFVAIRGPSGSGKSTLLHILGLLDRPTGGKYKFAGQNINELDDNTLAHLRNHRIGFIFQAFHLLARASVLNNVMLPLQYSTIPKPEHRTRALTSITKVGLEHRLHHTPAQLSGGEKQRAVIARALITKPDILFADEPTGNLDSKTGQTIMKLINQLHQEGLTVIVITHETPTAAYAKRIMKLADGQLISDKTQATNHHHYPK